MSMLTHEKKYSEKIVDAFASHSKHDKYQKWFVKSLNGGYKNDF